MKSSDAFPTVSGIWHCLAYTTQKKAMINLIIDFAKPSKKCVPLWPSRVEPETLQYSTAYVYPKFVRDIVPLYYYLNGLRGARPYISNRLFLLLLFSCHKKVKDISDSASSTIFFWPLLLLALSSVICF
jgi:hypothetical protein